MCDYANQFIFLMQLHKIKSISFFEVTTLHI